ncbi:thiamine biosynthesis FAD oxidoreductase protein (plasmid) [Rhizobium etli CFN 42]|uniref:Putative thiamine biosynthesis oxidoreductase ThiO n=2 Tax=Rhizobium etli TaxID=29449 RepID=THIO_RHIEC|nr:glycine oxidase ThiO [Rhizobium etli]O34292.1 RecName: Full=Putative thiamine biosynthesis oxidoreductase ThiO [Rhizobium etli CFN 42]AAC45973.1 putative amino acid oxidase flavoprotein [Rhizobium etli]ABC93123.1 thiamine biosynthesis FAD oxidoreductase protein [Rhizobium etli CFN 42]AGS24041.1 thiamine biosynthesis glycine oxidase protein ThiO [Rhizobium etli bv. mimosae str. Mim1]ARQ12326.1 thiamine biosynthesis glycine oxidase protein ThiO 1 [Rhizobium etli]
MRILVNGAGVAGLTVAWQLYRHGFRVTLAERAGTVGAGASGFAGGMLAPWCERESAEEPVLTLGRLAADWWEAALPGHVHRRGTLVVAGGRDTGELDRFSRRTSGWEWLDEVAIAALEPDLAGRFRRALFFRQEAHLDPRQALAALAAGLEDARMRLTLGVVGESDVDHDRVVDCTGAAQIGRLPGLRGVRGEMLCVETTEVSLSRPVRLLHPRHPIYIVPRDKNRFMVGATMIESDDGGPITARSLMELLNAAYAMHPAFGEARVTETGAGVRPAYPDNLPRVTQEGRTLHVNGLYRHGFLLAPAMAGEVARRLLTEQGQPERRAS